MRKKSTNMRVPIEFEDFCKRQKKKGGYKTTQEFIRLDALRVLRNADVITNFIFKRK